MRQNVVERAHGASAGLTHSMNGSVIMKAIILAFVLSALLGTIKSYATEYEVVPTSSFRLSVEGGFDVFFAEVFDHKNGQSFVCRAAYGMTSDHIDGICFNESVN